MERVELRLKDVALQKDGGEGLVRGLFDAWGAGRVDDAGCHGAL